MSKILARTLVALLAVRHSKDVFIPECRTGCSKMGVQIFDALAIKRSWAHPRVCGYEVKVTSGDFRGDQKWPGYPPFCNEFSFVCPPGVIDKSEVPEIAGLIVCSQNGTRLYTKKKAPYREVEVSSSLLLYVLFSRVKVLREWNDVVPGEGEAFWREWLSGKQDLSKLGHKVSRTLQRRIKEEITNRGREQRELEKKYLKLHDAEVMLTGLGFRPGYVPDEWDLKDKLKDAVPRETLFTINRAISALEGVKKKLRQITEPAEATSGGTD